jgi:glucose 1-dehydrogenase
MSDWLALSGKVCVVTGAASGIGAQTARALAAAGAKVALLDRDIAKANTLALELTQQGASVVALECDVSSEPSILNAAAQVTAQLGPAWGLVNNAGFMRASSLQEVSLADWNAVLSVNLTGYMLVARAFSLQMQAAGGSIVHIASVAANFPQSMSGAYSASKSGVLQLSRQMAVEWGGKDGRLPIRSNVICPGMIRTALSAKFYEVPGVERRRAALTASGRVGEPQDIADVALFLLSPKAAYVNAAEIAVDGGMPAMLMDCVPRPGYNFPLTGEPE